MSNYLLRRLLLMVPTLLGITLVVFAVMAASPGGIGAQSLVQGMDMKPQEKQALLEYYNRRYGLDQPAPIQYLRWLNNLSPVGFTLDAEQRVTGFSFTKGMDLGESLHYGRPVAEILAERIPITLLLNFLSLPLIYVVAITLGVKAATERGGRFDVGSGLFLLALWSIPTMLAGVLLLGLFANVQHWQWFPTAGIGSRAAQDMPFMPHWTSLWEVGKVGLGLLLGTGLGVAVARLPSHGVRAFAGAATGLLLGAWMASVHPDGEATQWGLRVLLPALGATLLGGAAWMGFAALRVAVLGLFGAGIGLALAMQFAGDGFVRGFLMDRAWHLVLPILCLSYAGFAALAKLTRTAVLENLHADYARTARAKGLSERQVLWWHVFPNSLIPLITVSAGLLPSLLAGSLIVENIFSIDGMGQLAVEAVKQRDRELVLAIAWISGALTLVGYLLADFLYALVDPRVSYD